MVQSCSAFGCPSRSIRGCNVKFHRFPKDAAVRQKWVNAMTRKDFKPSRTSVLCGKHFLESDYRESVMETKILRKEAVPCLFQFPTKLTQISTEPRRILVQSRQNDEEMCLIPLVNANVSNSQDHRNPNNNEQGQASNQYCSNQFSVQDNKPGEKEVLLKTQPVLEVKTSNHRKR